MKTLNLIPETLNPGRRFVMPSLRSASRDRRIRLGWSNCSAIPDRTYSLASRLVWAAESGISLPDGTHVPLTVSFMGGTPNYSPNELERSKLPEFAYLKTRDFTQ